MATIQPARSGNRATYTLDSAVVALHLMQGYLSKIARAAGVPWDAGNDHEIALMVTALVDAARDS